MTGVPPTADRHPGTRHPGTETPWSESRNRWWPYEIQAYMACLS